MTPIRRLILSFLLVALPASTSLSQDDVERRWLVRGVPDPAIIHSHDSPGYYVFATGRGISIWHSPDLETWKLRGRVFADAVPAWARQLIPDSDSIWAPDIHYANGQYYLYYSISTFGSQRSVIGLAVNSTLNADSPNYRWEDRGLVLESSPERNDYNAIDPAMFVDEDGRAFLFWGSYWTGIKAVEINADTGKPRSSQPRAISVAARQPAASTAIEAPYVIKRNGFYYLFVSWDFCCAREKSTYKVMVGRSSSPLGPYLDDAGKNMTDGGGKLVLMGDARWRGPGHNSVLQTKNGDWLVYHVIDAKQPTGGRVLQIRPLHWQDDWPGVGNPLGDETSPASTEAPLVGRWTHLVNDRDRYDIFLEANGLITGTKGEAFWEQTGDRLDMKWSDGNAPDGFWIDHLRLTEGRQRYTGENQNGIRIEGRKLP